MEKKTVFAVAVTLLMIAALVPVFGMADDSDSLTPNSNLELNEPTTVIYVAAGANHSTTYSVKEDTIPTGYSGSNVNWRLVDLDDGYCVSFSDSENIQSAVGGSVTVYGVSVGSVELVAEVTDDDLTEEYVASVVVVVFSSPTANATEFHFFFQINPEGYEYAHETFKASAELPNGMTMEDFNKGFWVTVKQSDVNGDFNAYTALEWYLKQHQWDRDIASTGWINNLLGLGTYAGPGSTYHYWAQYHAEPGSDGKTIWAFNNTTLSYITSVDSSYIGLIFWGSPSSGVAPTFPDYPAA